MTRTIKIAIEGPGADLALDEFLSMAVIQGEAMPVDQGEIHRVVGTLAAIGIIVGIVGGTASVVDTIIKWREKWQGPENTQRLNVIIEDGKGNRLALDKATPDQITAALQSLQSSGNS